MEISLALAFAAGFVSFASPCVLALVPVYLAFLGEAAVTPAAAVPVAGSRGTLPVSALPQAALFVLGFTAVFVLLGTSLGLLGSALFRVNEVRQAAGIGVIVVGVLATGIFGPLLDRTRIRVPIELLPTARGGRALALGALVAIGWTPCIGPVLGTILTWGASTGSAPVAAVLLVAYSAGMAVPFLAAAIALPRVRPALGWLQRHHRSIRVVSGLFIVLVGVLIYLNAFARLAGMFVFVL